MDERRQLCDAAALQNIRVLIREVVELNELRARVLEAEARLCAKHTATRTLERWFCHRRSALNPRQSGQQSMGGRGDRRRRP
jgi:hypothetical protein